jgi:hypothetical protein
MFSASKIIKEHFVANFIFFKKNLPHFSSKNLWEKILDTVLVLGANIFCQFFTVWTIVYKKKVSSINPKLICGRSLVMPQASNNGNKVHEVWS